MTIVDFVSNILDRNIPILAKLYQSIDVILQRFNNQPAGAIMEPELFWKFRIFRRNKTHGRVPVLLDFCPIGRSRL